MIPKTKVFVGSLPPGSKPDELRRLFEAYGVVTECDIMNRCGFVHMQTEEMAFNAINNLNNTNFKGTTISVERGRVKERGAGGGGGGRGGRGGGGGGFRGDRNGGGGGGGFRGGDRNGRMGGGGPMRGGRGGGPMRGGRDGGRGTPYSRDGGRGDFGDRRGSGGPMRNGGGGGYDKQPMMDRGGMWDRRQQYDGNSGFGGEDRRGFALPERRGYDDMDDGMNGGGYMNDRGGPMGGSMMDDRRGGAGGMRPPMPIPPMFDRRPGPGAPPVGGGGDMFSRRSPPQMRSGGYGSGPRGGADPYAQAFPPLIGRAQGGPGPQNRREMMPQRRY